MHHVGAGVDFIALLEAADAEADAFDDTGNVVAGNERQRHQNIVFHVTARIFQSMGFTAAA
jgi:hypothetical protein